MLEVIFSLVAVALILYIGSLFFTIIILVLVILFILPGVYSMLFGAPFIVTTKRRIDATMKLGNFKKSDNVVELGCGDGRIIGEVARRGVKSAIGYEFSLPTYFLALFRRFLRQGKEEIRFGNIWNQDYSEVDAVICFLADKSMERLKKEILPQLNKGARIISNDFKIKGMKEAGELHRVYLYVKNN